MKRLSDEGGKIILSGKEIREWFNVYNSQNIGNEDIFYIHENGDVEKLIFKK